MFVDAEGQNADRHGLSHTHACQTQRLCADDEMHAHHHQAKYACFARHFLWYENIFQLADSYLVSVCSAVSCCPSWWSLTLTQFVLTHEEKLICLNLQLPIGLYSTTFEACKSYTCFKRLSWPWDLSWWHQRWQCLFCTGMWHCTSDSHAVSLQLIAWESLIPDMIAWHRHNCLVRLAAK